VKDFEETGRREGSQEALDNYLLASKKSNDLLNVYTTIYY
jgi:hypothetical protein